MVLSLPWIVLSVLAYVAIATFWGTPGDPNAAFNSVLFEMTMVSGGVWTFTLRDVVMLIALLALFVEILKATRTRPLALLDHGLSVVVFIVCLILFVTVQMFTTSLFFFITVIALIDVVAGFSVGLRAARRDLSFGGPVG